MFFTAIVAAASAAGAGVWRDDILAAHNAARTAVQVPPLVWNEELATQAQGWAEFLAETHSAQHSPGWMLTGQGENIYVGCGTRISLRNMLAGWRDENRSYHGEPIAAGHAEPAVGHYTQMVWRNTKRVGCGLVTVSDRAYGKCTYLVCRYTPPGNIVGQRPY